MSYFLILDKVMKKFTIMQFAFTIGTASSNLHRSLASKLKVCNVQGRTMICLCLSLSMWQNLIMVLGLSVQQHLIWAQLMQLDFTMFDFSKKKFLQYVFLKKNQEFQECHFLNIQLQVSAYKWSLIKYQSSHLKAKS